ncbi:MAG: hypothetical protein ACRCWJ_15190 [Casimicrobium sp.]
MKKTPDVFFIAATTAAAGWAVYRKVKNPDPVQAGRVWVILDKDPTNTRMTIPRGAIKLTTRDRSNAARAAILMTQAGIALADTQAKANAQYQFTVDMIHDRYNVPQQF